MQHITWLAVALFLADWCIRLGLSLRVVMVRRPIGTSLAWLTVILVFPFGGALIYLLIGETRLGSRRAERARNIHAPYQRWLDDLQGRRQVDWSALGAECEPLARLTEAAVGIPALPGNELTLLDDDGAVFDALVADIDAAQRTCHLEFYIWHVGGRADDVAAALLRAAARGVVCRVLVDAVGSKQFLRSALAESLRGGGVALRAALPVSLLRMLFVRFDLRMHRKIVVLDGETAYTGSLNLVDPRFFKQDAGVGEWIDAMVRLRGPAVEALGITFLEDWELETGEGLEKLRATGDVHRLDPCGPATVQAAPSGPAVRGDAIEQVLLMAVYAARNEIVLTTPYFVPDEPLLIALIAAARRGVVVTLLAPERVDSKLVRYASQAYYEDLLAGGVRLALFRGGLLHTKSVAVDGEFALFGSLNLDPRSLRLNFEITLAIYDRDFTCRLRKLQEAYLAKCEFLTAERWRGRGRGTRLKENVLRLLGPLL